MSMVSPDSICITNYIRKIYIVRTLKTVLRASKKDMHRYVSDVCGCSMPFPETKEEYGELFSKWKTIMFDDYERSNDHILYTHNYNEIIDDFLSGCNTEHLKDFIGRYDCHFDSGIFSDTLDEFLHPIVIDTNIFEYIEYDGAKIELSMYPPPVLTADYHILENHVLSSETLKFSVLFNNFMKHNDAETTSNETYVLSLISTDDFDRVIKQNNNLPQHAWNEIYNNILPTNKFNCAKWIYRNVDIGDVFGKVRQQIEGISSYLKNHQSNKSRYLIIDVYYFTANMCIVIDSSIQELFNCSYNVQHLVFRFHPCFYMEKLDAVISVNGSGIVDRETY